MAEFLIDVLFDEAAIDAQTQRLVDKVSKSLTQLRSFTKNLDGSDTQKAAAESYRAVSSEIDNVTQSMADLKKISQELSIQRKQQIIDYAKENQELKKSVASRRDAAQAAREAARADAESKKLAREGANEYFQLNKALQDAELRYKNLALTQGFSNKQTQIALKEALSIRNVLDKVDQNLRNYQRNVGNYGSAFNGLNASFQQILREAPSAAVSLNTFFLAVSNNLPILFDEITKINKANKEGAAAQKELAAAAREAAVAESLAAGASQEAAAASGLAAEAQALANAQTGKAPSVLKQLSQSLFSVNSFITLSVLGLTLFGGKIIDFIGNLFRGGKAINDLARQTKILAEVNAELAQQAGPEIAKLESLYKAATNAALSTKERKKAVDELQKVYPEYFKNLDDEAVLQGKAVGAYEELRKKIIEVAKTKAIEGKLTGLIISEIEAKQERERLGSLIRNATNQLDSLKQKAGSEFLNPKGLAADTGPAAKAAREQQVAVDSLIKKIAENNKKLAENKKDQDFLLSQITAPDVSFSGGGGSKGSKSGQGQINDNTQEEILKQQFERVKIILERAAKLNEDVVNDETKSYLQRLEALRSFGLAKSTLLDAQLNFEVQLEQIRIAKVVEGLEKEKKEKGANVSALNAQIRKEVQASNEIIITLQAKAYDDQLQLQRDYVEKFKKISQDKKIAELGFADDLIKQLDEKLKKQFEKEKEYNKKIKDAKLQLYEELKSAFFQFIQDQFTREEQYLEEQQRLNTENKDRRLREIDELGLPEIERIKERARVEKEAAFQNEQIEKRKRALAVERARFEKFANIASIISTTAQAVVNALADKTIPSPLRIALASTIGAIGLVQLAKAISAPLPRYKTGRGKGRDEYAIVDDGGVNEPILREDGSIEISSGQAQPRLTHLAKNDMVFKDHKSLVEHMLTLSNPYSRIMGVQKARSEENMTEKTGKRVVEELIAIRKKTVPYKKESSPIELSGWYMRNIKGLS